MVIIKTSDQVTGIRASSRLAALVLQETAKLIKPDITTESLDQFAANFIAKNNAIAAPLNYGGFPKSICTSVNNVVCHGIPSTKKILKNGDIINIDITTILNGFYGDVSATFPVGEISEPAQLLITRTKNALDLAIKSIKPGKFLNDCVGKIIDANITPFGYSAVRELGGHGVGLKFHEDPFVFHYDNPTTSENILLKPGMIFTVEPMINASRNWHVTVDKYDGWTVYTQNGSLSCQFEHTVLVTSSGREILTKI
ncbi:MAG: type I methionyl aminopeptidase [Candidatus Shapirobacteria bacterium]|jgi:methionyl aminopeptidase